LYIFDKREYERKSKIYFLSYSHFGNSPYKNSSLIGF
jgi:hypothetical protein